MRAYLPGSAPSNGKDAIGHCKHDIGGSLRIVISYVDRSLGFLSYAIGIGCDYRDIGHALRKSNIERNMVTRCAGPLRMLFAIDRNRILYIPIEEIAHDSLFGKGKRYIPRKLSTDKLRRKISDAHRCA